MKTAFIIDDQDHALKQIEHEFPGEAWPHWNFIHLDTVEQFRKQRLNRVDVVFLDFFLSKDRLYGLDILPEIKSRILICFSSRREMSDAMADDAVKKGFFEYQDVYSVQKLKDSIENPELAKVLDLIAKSNRFGQ